MVFENKRTASYNYGNCINKCNCGNHVSFGPHLIQEVGIYKYLGIELDKCLSFKDFKQRLLEKAKFSMSRVWSMGMKDGTLSVKAGINLYDALVRSQLEYGTELWCNELWAGKIYKWK